MKNELTKHRLAYLLLLIGLILMAGAFLVFWPHRGYQRGLAVLLGGFYFGWGVITHTKSSRLTVRVAIEYLLIGGLASLLLILLTV